MRKGLTLFSVLLIGASYITKAQTDADLNPVKKAYYITASEFIFSEGKVEAVGLNTSNITRFSAFLHLSQQVHYDVSKNFGLFSGLALRNVGIITDLNDTVRIKQRVYTLGIPVGFKVGNMNGTNLMLGLEAEFAMNYKQKVYVNDSKQKTNIWFSDRTEIFLPSVFGQINTKSGVYIKFKYYLTDFLVEDKQKIDVLEVNYVPTKSSMAYISVGFAIPNTKL